MTQAPLRVAVPVEQLWHRVPGGTARATAQTIEAFAAIDSLVIKPIAAWHRHSRRHPAMGPDGDGGPHNEMAIRHVPLPRPALYESWIRFDRPLVERSVGAVDVVWAASMIPVPSRSPMVATVHDLGFLDNPERSSRRGRSFFPRAWAGVRDRAVTIVCPSHVVRDDCIRYGVEPERARVVHWGVSQPTCSIDDAERIRESFGLPERYVLWVGTLEPRKNLPRLVEAMSRVDGPPLAVVGPPGWNLDGADVLAPLGQRVHRLGLVDDTDLSGLYAGATAFVLPSLVEGFGLPVLEAMVHGTPVVTSRGTATEEVAGEAAILVDPTDPQSITDGLELILGDDDTRMRLAELGRQRAAEFSWSTTAERYAAILREAAGTGR